MSTPLLATYGPNVDMGFLFVEVKKVFIKFICNKKCARAKCGLPDNTVNLYLTVLTYYRIPVHRYIFEVANIVRNNI